MAALALTCATASAQAGRSGPTFSMGGGSGQQLVYTPDVAYDSVHNRYFAVHGHGLIEGALTDGNGAILAVPTPINASRLLWGGEYAQTPRVAFSPDVNGGAGGYLVTWHETMPGGFARVRGRLVSADGVAIGGDIDISLEAVNIPTSSNWLMGAAVAYSTASKEFLVTWMGSFNSSNDVRCNRVSPAGVVLQAAVTPVTSASPDWERDPDVVYNPDTDEFLIVYAGYHNAANYAYVAGQRVKAGTGQLLGGPVEYDQIGGGATYIPAVAYNSQSRQYLAVWYHRSSAVVAFYGIKINADATAASGLIVESTVYRAYDALGLKYNPVSGDYLVVTHSNTYEDAAISIKSDGAPYDNGFIATSTAGTPGQRGNFNPRVTTSTKSPNYLLITASGFAYLGAQFITSSAAPPGPVSTPKIVVDGPIAGNVKQPFTIKGWAVDLASPNSSGVDDVDLWAWPLGAAAPIFLASVSPSNARPDIGAQYGPQFTNSGFSYPVRSLTAGSYTLIAFMHSTVTTTFNAYLTVAVNVVVGGGGAAAPTAGGGDFDADGHSDPTVYNMSSGTWATLTSASNYTSAANTSWGGAGYTPVAGDFDGDGKADLAVYEMASGNWYVLLSSTSFSVALVKNAGGPGWKPVPGDYDGDGKTDFAVYNCNTGLWFGLKSGSGYSTSVSIAYGGTGFTAVPGDYDGDGKADIGVYETATGNWSILLSSSNYTTSLTRSAGGDGWLPVAADYDGDGKTDPAVYNKSTGAWFALKSGGGYTTTVSVVWGGPGFTPVRGDFDGDGKADLAVYDDSSGTWAVLLSASGYTTSLVKSWGGAGWVPVSAFF